MKRYENFAYFIQGYLAVENVFMAGEFPLHPGYPNYIEVGLVFLFCFFQENYFTYLKFQVIGQTTSSALVCLFNGLQRVVRVG